MVSPVSGFPPPICCVLYLFLDMSAARHADVLFVKTKEQGENDLAAYCNKEGIKHILFPNFSEALKVVKSVVKGDKTTDEVLAVGHT
jgi:hypothetical protein